MSLLKKAGKFRKKYLNRHLIGKSLGLLNRAESFLFLKNNDRINFEDEPDIDEKINIEENGQNDTAEYGVLEYEKEDNKKFIKNRFEEAETVQIFKIQKFILQDHK